MKTKRLLLTLSATLVFTTVVGINLQFADHSSKTLDLLLSEIDALSKGECASGGQGASSCSYGGNIGGSGGGFGGEAGVDCSIECSDGYYACCNIGSCHCESVWGGAGGSW